MNLQHNQQPACFSVCNMMSHHQQRASSRGGNPVNDSVSFNVNGLTSDKDQQAVKNEMDKLLAQAMTGLTFEERQQHQEILHGVDKRIAEEAPLIEKALEELDLHVLLIKERTKYQVAEKMDHGYVHARSFRVMFLRANEYDAKAAADQMIRFFESKFELFGESKLTKDVSFADLKDCDIASLEKGWIQLPGTDQSGRQIVLCIAGVSDKDSPEKLRCHLRCQYFVIMRALQSESTQLRGVVSVWYTLGNFKYQNSYGYKEVFSLRQALPQKKMGVHLCVDEVLQYVIFNFVVKNMPRKEKVRCRVHFGSHVECKYQLRSYGIQPSTLPIDDQGRLDLTMHRQWIHSCAIEDNAPYGLPPVAERALQNTNFPNQNDVLFYGISKSTNNPGNKRLRAIVADLSQAYYANGNDEVRRSLVATVIGKIHASGGRFLLQRENSATSWEEVPAETLKKKVMQMFRNRRRKQNASGQKGVVMQDEPLPCDVIFGRNIQRSVGTELLNSLIKDKFNEYESLDRGKKMMLVEMSIMHSIKNQGGRFLAFDLESCRWIELSNEDVRERISKSFRNFRRRQQTASR